MIEITKVEAITQIFSSGDIATIGYNISLVKNNKIFISFKIDWTEYPSKQFIIQQFEAIFDGNS